MTLPLAGPAFAWLYGAAWRKPHGLQRMRPVSALEHCLLAALVVLVIYPLVHLLVLTLIHWPASKIDYLRSLAYWQGLDDDARRQLWEQLEKGHPWPHELALYLPWRMILLWQASLGLWLHTVLSAIYLLGSLLFRRDAGIKTSACVFALLLLTLFLSLTADTQMDHWLDLEDLFFSAPQARGVKKSALHWLANALFWLGVPLSLWLAVFQALLQRLSVPPLLAGTQRSGLWMASCALGLCWLWGGLLLTVVLAERHKPQTVFELSGSTIEGVDAILLHSEPEFYPREVIVHFDDVPHIRVSLEENVIFYRHPPRLLIERKDQTLHLRAERDASEFDRPESVHIKEITLPLHVQHLYGEHLRLYVRQGQRLPELHAYGNSVHWHEGAADQLTLLAHAPCETPEITAHQAESRARDRAREKDRSGHPFPWMFDIWETDQPAAMPPVCADCADNAYGYIELNAEHVKQARVFISGGRLGLNHVHAGSAVQVFVGAEVQPSISFRPPEILQYDDYRNAVRSLIQRSDLSADYYANLLRPSLACQLPASAAAQATASDPQATLQQP